MTRTDTHQCPRQTVAGQLDAWQTSGSSPPSGNVAEQARRDWVWFS